MNHEDMLARLVAQAVAEGGELVTLRAIVEEASEIGARRALRRIGLADADAEDDIDALRELLAAWRAAKAATWKAAIEWLARGALALLLIGLTVRFGLPGDNTYSNYREASRALWRLTLLPLAGKILGGISDGLRPWFPELSLAVDLDRVPALAEDRERLWAQVSAADFLEREEKRALLGIQVENKS